jgi:hypothetical protein
MPYQTPFTVKKTQRELAGMVAALPLLMKLIANWLPPLVT